MNKDRFITKMFLRGDNVVMVMTNPGAVVTPQPATKKRRLEEPSKTKPATADSAMPVE